MPLSAFAIEIFNILARGEYASVSNDGTIHIGQSSLSVEMPPSDLFSVIVHMESGGKSTSFFYFKGETIAVLQAKLRMGWSSLGVDGFSQNKP